MSLQVPMPSMGRSPSASSSRAPSKSPRNPSKSPVFAVQERSRRDKVSALLEHLRLSQHDQGVVAPTLDAQGRYASFGDFMRAGELLDGGIINDFITRDYFQPAEQRSQRLPIVSFYKWYRALSVRGIIPATVGDDVCPLYLSEGTACKTAAEDSLQHRLRQCAVKFYRGDPRFSRDSTAPVVPSTTQRQQSGGAGAAASRSLFHRLALEVAESRRQSKAVGKDVQEVVLWWLEQRKNHVMLNRDAASLRADHDADFWKLYHTPDRKVKDRQTRNKIMATGISFKPSESVHGRARAKAKGRVMKAPKFFDPTKPAKVEGAFASNGFSTKPWKMPVSRPESRAISSRQGRATAMSEIAGGVGGGPDASFHSFSLAAAAAAAAAPLHVPPSRGSRGSSRGSVRLEGTRLPQMASAAAARPDSKGAANSRTLRMNASEVTLPRRSLQRAQSNLLGSSSFMRASTGNLSAAFLAECQQPGLGEGVTFDEFTHRARGERSGGLRKVADLQRRQQTTLPSIATTMHTCAVLSDEAFAMQDLKKSTVASKGFSNYALSVQSNSAGRHSAGGVSGSFISALRILGPQNDIPTKLPPVVGHAAQFNGAEIKSKESDKDRNCEPAAEHYIQICHAAGAVPTPQVMSMAASGMIKAGLEHEVITDCDLAALTAMVTEIPDLRVVDLSRSAMISDKALANFLWKLLGHRVGYAVCMLSMNGCKGFSMASLDITISLLVEPVGLPMLSHLDLGSIPMPSSRLLELCTAVSSCAFLRNVDLSDTGLGLHRHSQQCISTLLSTQSLEKLNLSWNGFSDADFIAIGEGVCRHGSLRSLVLSHCSVPDGLDAISPITVFFECLGGDENLTHLDVSSNRIDYRAALVVEDGLQNHRKLTSLQISNNPLGSEGLRSLLRLLARESSALMSCACTDCESPSDVALDMVHYNCTNPSGGYELKLWLPHHRAALRMLYKTCTMLRLSPNNCFGDVLFDADATAEELANAKKFQARFQKNSYQHPTEDKQRGWVVPSSGILKFRFNIDEVFNRLGPPDKPSPQPVDVAADGLNRYLDLVCVQPRGHKAAALLAQWHGLSEDVMDPMCMLQALSRDFRLDASQISHLCGIEGESSAQVLSELLHFTIARPVDRYLCMISLPRLEDYLQVYSRCHNMLKLNVENATGHYNLDLGNPADRAVAETIVLLDKWEASVARRQGREDMSMYGKWTNIRTCMHRQLEVTDLADWHLPSTDALEFDFATWRRPPACAVPLGDEAWKSFVHELRVSLLPMSSKLAAIHGITHHFYLTTRQMREVLGLCRTAEQRVSWLMLGCLRLTDPQNSKVMRSRLADLCEWNEVRRRIGTLALFAYIQPEEESFHFDLSKYDERVAASLAVTLSVRERVENIKEPRLTYPDGEVYSFPQGIPSHWADAENIPTSGIWRFQYSCGWKDRQLALRRELAAKYGGWDPTWTTDADITWWRSNLAAKPCMSIFLRRVMQNFSDPSTLFYRMLPEGAAATGMGTATRQIFTRVIKSLGWKEFSDEPDLVRQVFRCLNPDNSGQLSIEDWDVVRQLAADLQVSTIEFLQHVDAVYMGDFDLAFEDADTNGGSGSSRLDRDAWDFLVQRVMYSGPDRSIFQYYCSVDGQPQGGITRKGWHHMEEAWRQREETLKAVFSSWLERADGLPSGGKARGNVAAGAGGVRRRSAQAEDGLTK